MAINVEKIPFGLANITVGEPGNEKKFDGKEYHQAEGGEITITPVWEDFVIQDYGTTRFTKKIVGYEVNVNIVAAEEDIETLLLAMGSYTSTITDSGTGDVIGFTDSPIGTDARNAAVPVTIHPRNLPAGDKTNDIHVYKMASTGEYTRAYQLSQGNVAIQLEAFIRDGADPTGIGNYFYFGGVDPNSQP